MAPKKPKQPRAATTKRKRAPSASDDVSDTEDGGKVTRPRRGKKQKSTPASPASPSAHGESSRAGSESPEPAVPTKTAGKGNRGLDTTLPPISDVREMFKDLVKRLNPTVLGNRPIQFTVATLCSGTDAPIFALGLIQDAMEAAGLGIGLEFEHLYSCEIEPFKQGFIRRNLPEGTLIFRDVVELATTTDGKA